MRTMKPHYEFTLPPLCYDYDALEPYIDAETVYLHHDKHFKTYTDNLNAVLKNYPKLWYYSIDELLTKPKLVSKEDQTKLLNNAGGYYNHDFYFKNMRPGQPATGPLGGWRKPLTAASAALKRSKKNLKSRRSLCSAPAISGSLRTAAG